MITQCPECELPVSSAAIICPHCGYHLRTDKKPTKPRNKNPKHKRLPNGFGQISEIKGRKLRKPFRLLVTVGKNSKGRPICKPLKPEAYFSTYNDAYAALAEYNKNPYDLGPSVTMKELYEKWSNNHFKKISEETASSIEIAWRYCSSIYKMRVMDVRTRHIKECIENGNANIKGKKQNANANTKNRIKSLFNQMMDYAVEYELTDRNYSRNFKLSEDTIKEIETTKQPHIAFTDKEINILWENINKSPYIDALIIQCYSGWRPQEVGLIKLEDVDVENWIFKGGLKTDSGKERIVPIHSKIRQLVLQKYNEAKELGSDYWFNCIDPKSRKKDLRLSYQRYQYGFSKIKDELNLNPNHRLHDGRLQFVTISKKYKVDDYAIKYIVGHKIKDITERVYTKRELN